MKVSSKETLEKQDYLVCSTHGTSSMSILPRFLSPLLVYKVPLSTEETLKQLTQNIYNVLTAQSSQEHAQADIKIQNGRALREEEKWLIGSELSEMVRR